MINDQLYILKINDELHIPDVKGECESWVIETAFDKGAFLAIKPSPSGKNHYSTLVNSNRYNLANIHLAGECPHGQRSKDNGTY